MNCFSPVHTLRDNQPGTGHFYALVKRAGQWYDCNDSSVSARSDNYACASPFILKHVVGLLYIKCSEVDESQEIDGTVFQSDEFHGHQSGPRSSPTSSDQCSEVDESQEIDETVFQSDGLYALHGHRSGFGSSPTNSDFFSQCGSTQIISPLRIRYIGRRMSNETIIAETIRNPSSIVTIRLMIF